MATLQSGKCFTVPTFFGMCCRSEWQERMYIYKWHEVDQTKHEIFCVHIVCNEIQVKVNLEITTFFFYLRFPYCPNFFWFGVVHNKYTVHTHILCKQTFILEVYFGLIAINCLIALNFKYEYFSYTNVSFASEGLINPLEPCGALFMMDGWMHFNLLQNLNTHSLLLKSLEEPGLFLYIYIYIYIYNIYIYIYIYIPRTVFVWKKKVIYT